MKLFKTLQFELSHGIGRLTICRPQSLNSLNAQVLRELSDFAKHTPPELQVLIIKGAGDRAFVAGADIQEMAPLTSREAEVFSRKGQQAFSAIESLPFPVIALIQGFALGGGLELALACDLLLLGEKAQVGLPEVTLGLFPAFGGTQRLVRSVGFFKAKEMIFSGNFYTAKEALEMGLANYVLPEDQLMDKALSLAGDIKKRGPLAVAKAKTLVHQARDLSLAEGLDLEAVEFGRIFNTEDSKEGLKAFIEKRKPVFKGQ